MAIQACTLEECGNSSLHTREVWQFKFAHQRPERRGNSSCTSERCGNSSLHTRGVRQFKFAHQTEWRQQAASAVCCGDINAIPEFSESLRRPIRQ
ncbi:MAG: hypothetical protein ACK55Z_29675, partial [bacterium]